MTIDAPAPTATVARVSNGSHASERAGWGGARANSGGARPGAGRKPKPPPAPAPPDPALRWHCVRTGYRQELVADIQIRLAGFELFAPTLWKAATPPRRDSNGAVRAAKPDRIVPLFPRYLLVRFRRADPAWRGIWRLPGVDSIISSAPEAPIAVPDDAVDLLRRLTSANGCLYPPGHVERAAPLAVGASVKLLTGPMAELQGICEMSDGRRARVLLSLMGRTVPVTVRQSELEAA